MPTASNVRAERVWPAVPEHIWESIREEFTLPTAIDMDTHFQSLGDPEAMRRAVRVFLSGLLRVGHPQLHASKNSVASFIGRALQASRAVLHIVQPTLVSHAPVGGPLH